MMMTEDRTKLRTWLCSVVFVDIVKYSTQSVDVQMTWKGRFNGYVADAIGDLAVSDRVILDTGDGAAICFLGDPEAAMFATLRLLDSLVCDEPKCDGPMRVRIGINLGSVKLLKDINGNLNAVGDGINVAQRVMSFAGENQILVSRSFYEVVSCLSDAYHRMFRYNGVRKDKHVREHTVYDLQPPGVVGQPAGACVFVVAPPSPALPMATVALDPAVVARIEAALRPIIGPIADRLVRTASSRAATPAELVRLVAEFIPVKEDREGFVGAFAAEFGVVGGDAGSAVVASDPAELPVSAVPEPVKPAPWDPAVLERARTALAVYVGPMARVIVARAAAKAQTLKQLYDLLAGEIPTAEEREKFRKPRV